MGLGLGLGLGLRNAGAASRALGAPALVAPQSFSVSVVLSALEPLIAAQTFEVDLDVSLGGGPTPPSLVGVSAFVSNISGTTATPDISALGVQADDIVIVQVYGRIGAVSTWSAPGSQGWNLIANSSAAGQCDYVFWKRWGTGVTDDTTPTFTCSNTGEVGGAASVWRGCDTTGSPIEQQAGDFITNVFTASVGTSVLVASPPAAGTTTLVFFDSLDDNAHGSPATTPNVGTPSIAYGGASYDESAGANDWSISLVYMQEFDASVNAMQVTQTVNGNDNGRSLTVVLSPA